MSLPNCWPRQRSHLVSETIFNIFLPFDQDDHCDHALYTCHRVALDDEAAVRFLQGRVEADLKHAIGVPLARPFTRSTYYARCRIGEGHHLYDDVFRAANAQAAPLFVTTLVVNGKARSDVSHRHGDPNFYLGSGPIKFLAEGRAS